MEEIEAQVGLASDAVGVSSSKSSSNKKLKCSHERRSNVGKRSALESEGIAEMMRAQAAR